MVRLTGSARGPDAVCLVGTALAWMQMLQSFLTTFVDMGVPPTLFVNDIQLSCLSHLGYSLGHAILMTPSQHLPGVSGALLCVIRKVAEGKRVLQALFFTYGGMEPSTASLVAEMLGFNPDLVMPQLHHELTTAEQADASRP